MSLTLGAKAVRLELVLTPHAAFICTLHNTDGPWDDCQVWIEFDTGQRWDATIDHRDCTWTVPPQTVDEAVDAKPQRASLWYSCGQPIRWAAGNVKVDR